MSNSLCMISSPFVPTQIMKFRSIAVCLTLLAPAICASIPVARELPRCAVSYIKFLGCRVLMKQMHCIDQADTSPNALASNPGFCNQYKQGHSPETCVQMYCPIREALGSSCTSFRRQSLIFPAFKNIIETTCGLSQRNRTKTVSITGIVGVSLAMLAFLLRLLAKTVNHQLGVDDWTMMIAMVLTIRI